MSAEVEAGVGIDVVCNAVGAVDGLGEKGDSARPLIPPGESPETCGRHGGTVRKPCHNAG